MNGLKIGLVATILVCSSVMVGLFYQISVADEELKQKESMISGLQSSKSGLESSLAAAQSLLENITSNTGLRDLTWAELQTFLSIDNTNELAYINGSFDCPCALEELDAETGAVEGVIDIDKLVRSIDSEKGLQFCPSRVSQLLV